MELDEVSFLEELMALRGESLESYPVGMNELLLSGKVKIDGAQDFPNLISSEFGDQLEGLTVPAGPNFDCLSEIYNSFSAGESAVIPEVQYCNVNNKHESIPFLQQESKPNSDDEDMSFVNEGSFYHHSQGQKSSEPEAMQVNGVASVPADQKNLKYKKVDGLPSKNLMAERRRRKRLNDRLLMLRSIVPKISKMDRTSILGDTIDYMKELLGRIKDLKEEMDDSDQENVLGFLRDVTSNETQTRNPQKLNVERRNADTRIEISCANKPGLLLSLLSTVDAIGIDIEQCVVSCFNDFGLQALCNEEKEHQEVMSTEEIKQTLSRVAVYGSSHSLD